MSLQQGPPRWFDEVPPPDSDDPFPPAPAQPQNSDTPPPPRAPTLWANADEWKEEEIPQRPWIARGYLLQGAVTIVAGPGAAGKSSLMVGWATALALGERWHRFVPSRPCRVLTYNVEDDDAEQMRRFSAILRQFGNARAT